MKIELYTDGSASRNGKPNSVAGWAWCLVVDNKLIKFGSGRIDHGTNNQGELQAIIEALDFLTRSENELTDKVIVISDSSYCIKGITEWVHNWKRNNWYRNSNQTQEVKNLEQWKRLDQLAGRLNLEWQWCKGHNLGASPWNEYVDKLAQLETKRAN